MTRERKPPREPVAKEGDTLADDLIGDDPAPVGGWRLFDADGNRVAKASKPKRQRPKDS